MLTPSRLVWYKDAPSFVPEGGMESAENEKAAVAKIAEDFMRRLAHRDRDVIAEFSLDSTLFDASFLDEFNVGADFKLLEPLVLDGKGSPKDRLRFEMERDVLTNPAHREKLISSWLPRLDAAALTPESIAYVVRVPMEFTLIHQAIVSEGISATETNVNHATETLILALNANREVVAVATPSHHFGPTVERKRSLEANAKIGKNRFREAETQWALAAFLTSPEELQKLFGRKVDRDSAFFDHSRMITVDRPAVGVTEEYPVHYFRLTRQGKSETVAFVFGKFPLAGFIRLSSEEVDSVHTVDDLYRLKEKNFYPLEWHE